MISFYCALFFPETEEAFLLSFTIFLHTYLVVDSDFRAPPVWGLGEKAPVYRQRTRFSISGIALQSKGIVKKPRPTGTWRLRHPNIKEFLLAPGFSQVEFSFPAKSVGRRQQAFPAVAEYFQEYLPRLVCYYRFPGSWRHRLRTVSLAEQFFSQM